MRRWVWVVVVVLVLLAVSGGVVVATRVTEAQRKVRRELRAAAGRHGLDPEIPDALGYVESRWKLGATNLTGADGARGGAWGPTQITERTARAHGYDGAMSTLGADAWLSAEWTARILAARPGGPPRTVEDAAAWWNAGKASAAQLGATHITRRDYIPKALAALDLVRETPA